MGAYVFDLETDGLLDEVTKVHCVTIRDVVEEKSWMYNDRGTGVQSIHYALTFLMEVAEKDDLVIGHNVIEYDIPVLKKLFPWFELPAAQVVDTLVYTRSLWPDLREKDAALVRRGALPKQLQKRHSLEAWGHRLVHILKDPSLYKGEFKGLDSPVYSDRWKKWSQEMEDYCQQDGVTTAALYKFCLQHHQSDVALQVEHQVAWILARQQRYGFLFDQERAVKLYAKLVERRLQIEAELKQTFKPFYIYEGELLPKRDNKTSGYIAGAPLTKVKQVEFNPSSRDHIVNRLMTLYGWQPNEFTDDGKAKMDESVIETLDIPEAGILKEYFLVQKRIGQVAEGKEAWLKKVGKDGRMHGRVNPNGAVTSRMTHSGPNMGQVPASYSPYGVECRECFIAAPGKVLVGADAAALELRDLAGYMALYDNGAYIETVLRGKNEDGTDMHSVNCRALGMDPSAIVFQPKETGRSVAKTWFYAFIYGAGDEKLGYILLHRWGPDAIDAGRRSRASFLKNLPALGTLVKRVKAKAKTQKYLKALDGRHIEVRSQHAALNTLLQCAGAVQMKHALVILDTNLQAAGLIPGVNYEFVANVHDEWQIEVDAEHGAAVGRTAVEAIRLAGEQLNFRCPLAGDFKVGANWAATH